MIPRKYHFVKRPALFYLIFIDKQGYLAYNLKVVESPKAPLSKKQLFPKGSKRDEEVPRRQ